MGGEENGGCRGGKEAAHNPWHAREPRDGILTVMRIASWHQDVCGDSARTSKRAL